MLNSLKKIVLWIIFYIQTIVMYVWPVLLIVLFFDFIYDFQINLFDESSSLLRVAIAVWFIIVNWSWFYVEFWEKIKKYL